MVSELLCWPPAVTLTQAPYSGPVPTPNISGPTIVRHGTNAEAGADGTNAANTAPTATRTAKRRTRLSFMALPSPAGELPALPGEIRTRPLIGDEISLRNQGWARTDRQVTPASHFRSEEHTS